MLVLHTCRNGLKSYLPQHYEANALPYFNLYLSILGHGYTLNFLIIPSLILNITCHLKIPTTSGSLLNEIFESLFMVQAITFLLGYSIQMAVCEFMMVEFSWEQLPSSADRHEPC
jgi:hypothetical protein